MSISASLCLLICIALALTVVLSFFPPVRQREEQRQRDRERRKRKTKRQTKVYMNSLQIFNCLALIRNYGLTLFCLVFSCFVLPSHAVSCFALCCLTLSSLIVPSRVVSCPVLFCLVLSCLGLGLVFRYQSWLYEKTTVPPWVILAGPLFLISHWSRPRPKTKTQD